MKLLKILAAGLGFGLIAILAGSFNPQAANGSGSAPVMVINTPLPVQGAVSVNNFPSSQPVSGTVNVGNFPSVLPVSFSNTSSAPLFTRDADNPAHNHFVHFFSCTTPLPETLCDDVFTLPSNRELVIETVTVFANLPSGERPTVSLNYSIPTPGGFALGTVWLPLTFEGTFPRNFIPPDVYAVTQPMRVYVDGGQILTFSASESGTTGGAIFNAEVTGYLVSCGAGAGCPLP